MLMSQEWSNGIAGNEKVLLLLGYSRLKISAIILQYNRELKSDSPNVQPQ
jgi:hypothetical protein